MEVEDGTVPLPGFWAGKISPGASDLRRLQQAAGRLHRFRRFPPAIRRAVILTHDPVLARRIHPADAESVDPDAMAHHAEGDVLGEGDEGALGGAIGGDERLPA